MALIGGIAACGIPSGNDTFESIEDADVPLDLASPSTTTTTTTTTTTIPPTTVLPESTTTINQPDTAPVSLYFVIGDQVLEVVQDTFAQYTPRSLIDLLAIDPDPTTSPGLETLVTENLVRSIEVRGGTATIDLNDFVLDRIRRSDRALVFAQLVLTIVGNSTRAGLVTFTFDDVPGEAELPDNLFRRTVTFDDYVGLIANAIVIPPTSTTEPQVPTETTTTTV